MKDYADDRYIDTSKYITGTIDVYVVSGHSIVDVKYNSDCVKGTAVKSAVMSGDYESVTVFCPTVQKTVQLLLYMMKTAMNLKVNR